MSLSLSKLQIESMTPEPGYDGQVTVPSAGAGLCAQVEGDQGYHAEDILLVYWNDKRVFIHTVTKVEEQNGISFFIEKAYVVPGDATVKYTIIDDQTGNPSDSLVLLLKVIPEEETEVVLASQR
ncbi:hypothetical protein [Pseudomonas brassicacearum]|uniref:Uncharacterized protein n=1 Tax=Pseudomonas brassicacearum TaxID=930166 RepID=A0A423GMC6_9PSED|nr:hypothetical protein [Pseudomonas brassicacearum]ROM92621.1 hypothetical protein BK658_22060 [Pseudomonas brassicacearum]